MSNRHPTVGDTASRKRHRPTELQQNTLDRYAQKFAAKATKLSTLSDNTETAFRSQMMSFPRIQPRKLVIKSFKNKPSLPADFEATSWARLRKSIHAIVNNQPVNDSLEGLYRLCEDLCHHKLAENLYKNVCSESQVYVNKLAVEAVKLSQEGHQYLAAFDALWKRFSQHMVMIRNIFLYLDRTYVVQNCNLQSLWELALSQFRNTVILNPMIQSTLLDTMMRAINEDRNNQVIPKDVLKSLIKMFVAVGAYFSVFEPKLKENTRAYYQEVVAAYRLKFDDLMETVNAKTLEECERAQLVVKYWEWIEQCLDDEAARCGQKGYIDLGSKSDLVKVVEDEMLKKPLSFMLDNGFMLMLDSKSQTDTHRLYQLVRNVGCAESHKLIRDHFSDYVKREVSQHVMAGQENPDLDSRMIGSLLNFRQRVDSIMKEAFDRDEMMAKTLKDAFEEAINKRPNKPAEMIASYMDMMMRGGKNTVGVNIDSALDYCLSLFRYIQGKDVFEAFYKKKLCKRLLMGKSASIDLERGMLTKLKAECGAQFTGHLERMFKDIDTSKDLNRAFKDSKYNQRFAERADFYVNVLSFGSWPGFPSEESLHLPEVFVKQQQAFTDFYVAKHAHRVLKWQYALDTCQMKARFEKGDKELDVSLYQCLVLYCFNRTAKCTLDQLCKETGLTAGECERTVQSLSSGKFKLLSENQPNTYTVNDEFTHPLYRVRVGNIQMKESAQETKETEDAVFMDRQHQVDAAIVRIMKSRKTLSHLNLMTELVSMLKFALAPADLKKRIETLIERDFMQRSSQDHAVYEYVA